jgi:deoxyadenosine/deoxycytidine kinase
LNPPNYIIIEGLIGVGKTTLATLLAERHQARLVLEQFEENPFLEKFYADANRYAFQTELSFLASRYKQQEGIKNRGLFDQLTIADYMFEKNRIFAGLTLKGDELALYDKIYRIMRDQAPVPDRIIFLSASVEQVQRNIKKRGRSYEQDIKNEYLNNLNTAYRNYLSEYARCPVAIVDCNGVDFVQRPADLKRLETILFHEPLSGIHFFDLNEG